MQNKLAAQLEMVSRSAKVLRYHTEEVLYRQSVGEHTYGVLCILDLMYAGAAPWRVLKAALYHDTAEYATGDVPAPTKRMPGVRTLFESMENDLLQSLEVEIPPLTDDDKRNLKLADCLEGALYCVGELERGNRKIKTCLDNYILYIEGMFPAGVAFEILQTLKGRRDAIS